MTPTVSANPLLEGYRVYCETLVASGHMTEDEAEERLAEVEAQ